MDVNKIYCMDCLEGMAGLVSDSVDLIVTSPPYNIGIDYGDFNDNQDFSVYKDWLLRVLRECFRVIKDRGIVAFVIGNQRNSGLPHYFYFLLKEVGFKVIKEIFWYKGLYYIQGESIFVCSKSGDYNCYYRKTDGFYSNGQFSTIWEMRYKTGESRDDLGHDAFFVKQIPRNFVLINTIEGDLVLDCFMGSGTTAVACKELGRNFIGFDISRDYCDVAIRRLGQSNLSTFFVKDGVV